MLIVNEEGLPVKGNEKKNGSYSMVFFKQTEQQIK